VTAIPFNRAHVTGLEAEYIAQAVEAAHLSAGGAFTRRSRQLLLEQTGARDALLVTSCTAALEMSALLLDLEPGDEVILPSYTFVTSATSFVLRGATPVFVDIRPDTLNLDETLIEAAITDRTKAIVVVHYAGVACTLEPILELARHHGLTVIEDAAQGVGARYRGQALGTFGSLGAVSFHETKNVTCGEGGALLINDERHIERAELLREKGTNRSRFFRGQTDKYTWVDVGSSYGLSDLAAAFLCAQLEHTEAITAQRLDIWHRYHDAFLELDEAELVRRPIVPAGCEHNAHMYYLLMPDLESRTAMLEALARDGVNAVFHYVPLHSSPAGARLGRVSGTMTHTDDCSDRLLRLPLWPDLTSDQVARVIDTVNSAARECVPRGATRR